MKVLLVNKFYYRRGGDCIYSMNLEELLRRHGHETAFFSMQHPDNVPTPWSRFFPSEVKFKPNAKIFDTLMRPFGSSEVKKKFNAMLDAFQPDVVHLNNIHSQLSPVVAELAHQRGIKVVWTLHDYKLLCPRYDFLCDGEVCERCLTDAKSVMRHSCVKSSKPASVLGYLEARKWHRERIEASVDAVICPSEFMRQMMMKGGYNPQKIITLHHFFHNTEPIQATEERKNYYCYIGRLSHEKGLHTLVKAANQLPYNLVVVGGGPLEGDLKKASDSNIRYVGFRQWSEIKEIVRQARFCVVPSEWYEVFGLVVMESQCLGTPVLGTRMGGIPELIEDGVSGMTFAGKDSEELKRKIEEMMHASFDYAALAQQAQERFSSERYYQQLLQIYQG